MMNSLIILLTFLLSSCINQAPVEKVASNNMSYSLIDPDELAVRSTHDEPVRPLRELELRDIYSSPQKEPRDFYDSPRHGYLVIENVRIKKLSLDIGKDIQLSADNLKLYGQPYDASSDISGHSFFYTLKDQTYTGYLRYYEEDLFLIKFLDGPFERMELQFRKPRPLFTRVIHRIFK